MFVYAQTYRGTTTIRPWDRGLNRFHSHLWSKPPRYNGRDPKPATAILPTKMLRLEERFTGWLRGVV